MAIYKYRARDGPEKIVEGTIESGTKEEAVEMLSLRGLLPVRVEEDTILAKSKAKLHRLEISRRKIHSRSITVFSRQLASLIRAGVPILRAIDIISEQSEEQHFQNLLHNIYNDLKDGKNLSSALANYPSIFSPLYIAMIRAGEDSGTLQEALLRISDYRQRQEETLSNVRIALSYPVVMAIVGVITVIFMLTFVMPRLMNIFSNMGQSLPLPTRILLFLSAYLRKFWLWILLGFAVLILLLKGQAKAKAGSVFFSMLKLRLPVFGKFILKVELARFSRTLELLIKAGIPILKAIELTSPVLQNELIKERLLHSYKELEQGGSFGRSLKKSKLFPAFMTNLIIVGEESGKLEGALAEAANSYERDIEETIKVLTSVLEPLMILVMGLIVGFIVIAMLLPVFQINVMGR